MATPGTATLNIQLDPKKLAAARGEIRGILADARKANQELAKLEARCRELGIGLRIQETHDE